MDKWREGLPEEIRGEKSLDDIKGENWETAGPVLAKSFVNAQKMLGGRIPLPTAETKDAFIKEHLPKLYSAGVLEAAPEKPEGYGLQKPERFEDELFKGFIDHAHKSKIPKSSVEAVVKWYDGVLENWSKESQRVHDESVAKLKSDLGASYDDKISLAQRAVEKYATDGLKQKLETYGLGDDPDLVRFWIEYAMLKGEDDVIKGSASSMAQGADAVKSKINAINNDPKHPYWDEKHPDHKKAVEEMQALFKQLT